MATARPSEESPKSQRWEAGGRSGEWATAGQSQARPHDHSQFISFPLLKATVCRSRCLLVGVRRAVLLVVGSYHGPEVSAVDFHVYQVLGARPFRKKLV